MVLMGPLFDIGEIIQHLSCYTSLRWHHSQVSSHSTNFLLEHSVVKPGLELSASSRSRGNTSSVLTTSDDDVGLDRSDASAVQGGFRRECFDDL